MTYSLCIIHFLLPRFCNILYLYKDLKLHMPDRQKDISHDNNPLQGYNFDRVTPCLQSNMQWLPIFLQCNILTTRCNWTIPDHNSRQQLGLSHSLLLVSVAPWHFVWSHQWHQICTAERQPLVGGRQGRGLQQWPGWTLFLRSLLACTLTICSSYFSSLYVLQPELLIDSQSNCRCFYIITYLCNHLAPRPIWNLIGGGHTHMVILGKSL